MAGEKLQGPFSFKVAKKILSQGDLDRLACAFLAMDNIHQVKLSSLFSLLSPFPFSFSFFIFLGRGLIFFSNFFLLKKL